MNRKVLLPLLLMSFPAYALGAIVDAVGITVADADRSVRFYHDVLGFETVADREVSGDAYEHLLGVFALRTRFVRMRLGEEHIELIDYLAPEGRTIPADSRSNDEWFQHIAIIVSDMDRAYGHLREHNVQHSSPGVQRLPDWNRNAGGIQAFYFKDPDGNPLEILAFPPDKGADKWHRGDRLFLGIDHTAIVVRQTEESLAFYRSLGFAVAGSSENFGPEQERLNSVFGARLRITTLRGAAGPGVELLEYLAPDGGRPMPPDTAANDLWHWQTHILMDDLAVVEPHRGGIRSSPTQLPDHQLGLSRGVLVRDPDGHASMLAEAGGTHE